MTSHIPDKGQVMVRYCRAFEQEGEEENNQEPSGIRSSSHSDHQDYQCSENRAKILRSRQAPLRLLSPVAAP